MSWSKCFRRRLQQTRTNFLANPITLHLHQTFYFFKTPSISFYFNLQYILSDFITSPWGIERVYITICNHTLPILKMVKLRNVSAMYSYIDRDQASSDKPLPGIKPTALLICIFSPVQFSSVAQSCLTLWDPMDCSAPGLPVHHQLPEFTQTHVHWVSDAIQPSYPVVPFSSRLQSFPASGSFQMSQFFASGGQSIGVSVSRHQEGSWKYNTMVGRALSPLLSQGVKILLLMLSRFSCVRLCATP